jgi:ubiquinone/menaquinone biosynthesis C-methylase UbiE
MNISNAQWTEDEKKFHDAKAIEYDSLNALGNTYNKKVNDKRVSDLVRLITETKATNILDVGCGSGYTLIPLLKQINDASFYAEDISYEMVKIAQDKIVHENIKTNSTWQIEVADAMQLPFADGSFQVVYLIHSLHHLPDLHNALTECHRVLKKGGILYINDPIDNKFLTLLGRWILRRKVTRENLSPHERSFALRELLGECRGLFHVENIQVSNVFATTLGKNSNAKIVEAAIFIEKILAYIPLINRIGLSVTLSCRKS